MRKCACCGDLIVRENLYCDRESCYIFWLCNPINNIIFMAIQDETVMELYMLIYKSACSSTRAKILFKDLPSCCSINKIELLITNFNVKDVLNFTEEEIFAKYGDLYSCLKYIVHTKYSLRSIRGRLGEANITRFDVIYDPIKEEAAPSNPKYMYHGSSLCNWASILHNGLKCTSPELMTNGAVYGNGVYLTDVLNIALGYSKETHIISVCEISSQSYEDYRKTNWCHVIPDANLVFVRSLLKIDTMKELSIIEKSISEMYVSKSIQQRKNDQLVKSKCSKRISNEILKLQEMGFTVSQNDDKLILTMMDAKCVVYISNYPKSAPIIYLINKPRILTNAITDLGIFVYNDFGTWIATNKLPTILIDIIPIMLTCGPDEYNISFDDICKSAQSLIY